MQHQKRNFVDSILGVLILFPLLFISSIAISSFAHPSSSLCSIRPELYTVLDYAVAFFQTIPFIIFMILYKPDRPLFKQLLPSNGNSVKNLLIGLVLGFSFNAICALISLVNKDISLSYAAPNIFYILLSVIAVIIQTGAEEFVCRLFLYQHLYRGYRSCPWIAVVLPSLIFAALHLLNPGTDVITVTHSIIIGIAWSLMIYVFDSFYMAWAYHFAWNYTQSIILGLPNSGQVFPLSIFKLDVATAQKAFAYDPVYGIEGSLLGLFFNILLALVLIYFAVKKKKAEKAS